MATRNTVVPNLILRTVYLPPRVDDKLRDEAFSTGISKNELMRRYISLGMKVASERTEKKSAASDATARKTQASVAVDELEKPAWAQYIDQQVKKEMMDLYKALGLSPPVAERPTKSIAMPVTKNATSKSGAVGKKARK